MKKLVYVFEDEVHIHRLIKLILEKGGFQSRVFEDGEEGLRQLQEGEKPDLLLLDIMMPGLDGLQILKTMKADGCLKDIPVILLTALSHQNIVLQGIKLGAIDYIRKPFHPNEMLERIQKQFSHKY